MDIIKYNTVIFDCDGVILQSNDIKTNAFRSALADEPEDLVNEFISYHKNHGGVSRYIKFQYYYKKLKKHYNYREMTKQSIRQYESIIVDKLIDADYVPGFMDVIGFFSDNDIPCYVVSGGDEQELNYVFRCRGIDNKFLKIYGSPDSKIDNLGKIESGDQLHHPALFFGDAEADMLAARQYGIDFCYVSQFSDWVNGEAYLRKTNYSYIYNFLDLQQQI